MFDLAWAQETGGATGTASSNPMFSMVLMWLPIILIFYFLVIRPGKKKQDQRRQMLNNLSKGDRIVTQGGLIGVIVSTSEKTITVKLGENMKVKLLRGAISGLADDTDNKEN